MLRRALGICASGLLLIVAPALAQDEDPADVLLGPTEEDTGPDYARDGFYLQIGYSYGIASKLEDQLNKKRDQFELETQPSDKIKQERLVQFQELGTNPPGTRKRTHAGSVNPAADGPCINANSPEPCATGPLNDGFDSEGAFVPAAPLDDLRRAQEGGTFRLSATPGLAPGTPTEFLVPGLDEFFEDDGTPESTCGHGTTQANLRTFCLREMRTLGELLGQADVSNSHGVNIRAGSRVLPNLAVEIQLEYMTGFEVDIPNFSQPAIVTPPPFPAGQFIDDTVTYLSASDTDKINVALLTLTVNLKVPLLTGRIQPYALLGGGASFVFRDNRFPRRSIAPGATSQDPYRFEEYVNVRDVGTVFRIGGGIDTYVNEHVFVSVESTWVATQGEAINDLRYASITFGVGYRF